MEGKGTEQYQIWCRAYDAENRLTSMSDGVTSGYVYDGDGDRVKETSGGATTVYPSATLRAGVGTYFERAGSTATMKSKCAASRVRDYYGGGTRVAMWTGPTSGGTVHYLLGDHLGSTALTLDSAGNRLATNTELRYMPYDATGNLTRLRDDNNNAQRQCFSYDPLDRLTGARIGDANCAATTGATATTPPRTTAMRPTATWRAKPGELHLPGCDPQARRHPS